MKPFPQSFIRNIGGPATVGLILLLRMSAACAAQGVDDVGSPPSVPQVIEIRPLSSPPPLPVMPSGAAQGHVAGPSASGTTTVAPMERAPGAGDQTIEIRKLPGDIPGLTAPPLPPAPVAADGPRHENGVTWNCGGVGRDDAQRMQQEGREHALLLVFAAKSGSFMANVTVRLIDPSGAVRVRTRCDGPMMWVDVDTPGVWQIDARGFSDGTGPEAGVPKTASVSLRPDQKGQRLVMVWPD